MFIHFQGFSGRFEALSRPRTLARSLARSHRPEHILAVATTLMHTLACTS